MLIVASANLLGYIFAREQVPQEISEWVLGPDHERHGLHAAGLRALDGPGHRARRHRRADPDGADPAADQRVVRRRPDRARRADDPVADDRAADAAGRARSSSCCRRSPRHGCPRCSGARCRSWSRSCCCASRSSSGRTRSSTCRRGWGCETQAPPLDSRRSILAGLLGQGVGPSLTPELHEREAARQGIRYVYKTVDLDDDQVDRRPPRDAARLRGRARLRRPQRHPPDQAGRWCRWWTGSPRRSRRSAPSTPS